MEKLFLHMAVFAVVTALVAAACFWFVRRDEERERSRR